VTPEDKAEAEDALQRAEEELQTAQDHNQEVRETVRTLKGYQSVNHFAEVITRALGGA
jgi:F0F1-type ATP synthase epsilon subunit